MNGEVELLSQGREPEHLPSGSTRAIRSVLGLGAVLGLLAAFGWWAGGSAQGPALVAVPALAQTFAPAPPLAPRLHQVHVSTTRQHARVTSRGHVELDLQLVNDGSFPLSLLEVAVPQAGVQTVPGSLPGRPTSAPPLLLPPDSPTAVTLNLLLRCPKGSSGRPADHLQLTLLDDKGAVRSTAVDLRSLPGFWDQVRRSACAAGGSGAIVDALPTSVRWEDGANGPLSG